MTGSSAYGIVVRLFPDYAESPIWLRTPIPYDVTQLSEPLIAELRSWEASYYAGLDAELAWRSAELETAFDAGTRRLGRRLADELGDEFVIAFHVSGDPEGQRVRGPGPARNPAAAAAFRGLAH